MVAKTAQEWTQDIDDIKAEIQKKYPELTKFVKEMPVILSANGTPDNDPRHMKAHYESLELLIKNYTTSYELPEV